VPDAQERQVNASLARHLITGGLFLEQLLGNYACGLVALETFFGTPDGEVTADYVSHRLGGLISEDTARRRLNDMGKRNIVTIRKAGRGIYFKLRPELAEAAISFMKGEPIVLPASERAA
jgi:hypothetical protein